jgi:hypothetical protein
VPKLVKAVVGPKKFVSSKGREVDVGFSGTASLDLRLGGISRLQMGAFLLEIAQLSNKNL